MPTTTPPPAGLSGGFSADVVTAGLRLRGAPSTNATIIRTLTQNEKVTVYGTPLTPFEQYDFAYLKDSQGNTGYAAISVNGVQQFAPPVVKPTEPPANVTFTAQQFAELEAANATIARILKEAKPA